MAQYTSTESIIAAVFARTSFAADHHRITALAVLGNVKNDYDDYRTSRPSCPTVPATCCQSGSSTG